MPDNGRFLRHRFSPKPTSVATSNSLPKRNHVAKEAVSAAWQTKARHRSDQTGQTERCSKDEAAALRKTHVARHAPRASLDFVPDVDTGSPADVKVVVDWVFQRFVADQQAPVTESAAPLCNQIRLAISRFYADVIGRTIIGHVEE